MKRLPRAPDRRLWLLVAAATLAPWPPSVRAQADPAEVRAWPPRSLRIVVAYPPGGVSSEIAREIALALARVTSATVVVEHRPGAGGSLAMGVAARDAGDGATLVFSAITPLTLAPLLGPLPYDPERDISPVLAVMATPVLVLGTPSLAADSLAGLLALARKSPGAVRWATSGTATTGHLVLERVAEVGGAKITHIPYKGGGQQLTDAVGGQFEVLSSNVAAAQLRLVREGRLRPLAVSGETRLAVLPQVPTLGELGFAAANQSSVFGLFVSGRTPRSFVRRINLVLAAAWSDPALQQRLVQTDNQPLGGSVEDFERRIASEREANRAWLGRRSGLQADPGRQARPGPPVPGSEGTPAAEGPGTQ